MKKHLSLKKLALIITIFIFIMPVISIAGRLNEKNNNQFTGDSLSNQKPDTNKKNLAPSNYIDSSELQQKNTAPSEKEDKIIRRKGDSILCKILSKNIYEIEYVKAGDKTHHKINTAAIKEIFYGNGKYELVDNNPEKKKKDWALTHVDPDWSKIIITYEANDMAGLVEKGPIDAFFESNKMTAENEFLEKNAYSILKKKASSMKATTVLITEKNINRTYGELPNITLKAVAYGKE